MFWPPSFWWEARSWSYCCSFKSSACSPSLAAFQVVSLCLLFLAIFLWRTWIHGFLCIYPVWGSWVFLSPQLDAVRHFCKLLGYYFFKGYFSPSSLSPLSGIPNAYMLDLSASDTLFWNLHVLFSLDVSFSRFSRSPCSSVCQIYCWTHIVLYIFSVLEISFLFLVRFSDIPGF